MNTSRDVGSEALWVRFLKQASLTTASILLLSVAWAAVNEKGMTAFEAWVEERRPRVLDFMKIHFICGLTAILTDISTVPQILST